MPPCCLVLRPRHNSTVVSANVKIFSCSKSFYCRIFLSGKLHLVFIYDIQFVRHRCGSTCIHEALNLASCQVLESSLLSTGDSATDQLLALQTELEERQRALEESKGEVERRKREAEERKREVEEGKREIEGRQKDLREVRRELGHVREEKESLLQQVDTLKDKLNVSEVRLNIYCIQECVVNGVGARIRRCVWERSERRE